MPTDTLLAVADELYALGPAEFTAARDARVKELKATDKELSARVKALRRPSVSAWAVNLFVRREAEQVEQVVAVGEALREAQANLDGDELRALTRQRRQLTAAVTGRVRARAAEEGTRLSDAAADQVEATLTAAMLDEGAAAAVRSGMLVTALSATGVDAVDVASAVGAAEALGFTPAVREAEPPPRPELHVVPDPEADEKRRRAAQEKVDAAEAEVAEAQEAYSSAAAEVGELEARTMQVQAELDELRRRIAELETTAEEVDDELGDAEDVRAEAEEALATAIREREAAVAALARLS